uniref:Retinoblastoma-like protein 1 n=1 Tax=Strigamia maritima TaxID=126957 RepID=T1J484_STRMM
MGLYDDSDEDIERRYQNLCADLNMDKNTTVDAWQSYEKINMNYTLEGDTLHWLACALYVSCRSSSVPTVGKSGAVIEGNCVSLTRLLRSCNLSLIQFFNKMKKWQDMANLSPDFRHKVDRLERNFAVSTVIFKKFRPIYLDIFKEPTHVVTKVSRGRKPRRTLCSSADVFSFCWTLFVQVKGNFPAISDDLVNSYHLLLSCIDLIYANAILADRREILNPKFEGLPANFDARDYHPPTEPPCIIDPLCKVHDGLFLEAKGIKEHWWKPHIQRLFDKKVSIGLITLKGKADTMSGLLDLGNFEANSKAVNRTYEEYVLNVGDFDERIFFGEDANVEIGAPSKLPPGDLAARMQVKRNLQQHLENTNSLTPSTPLTGRRYLSAKDTASVTPVSTATQSVSKLQALLSGRKTTPSDLLLEIFKSCKKDPGDNITARVKEMGITFCTQYAQPSDDHPGSQIDFAKKRLQLGESLYYKALENIMVAEKKRVPSTFDFTALLDQEYFHRALFACCLEIVIFSYNSQRIFPWIIEVFNLEPYYFYKVIELLIRAEDGLSRDVVKHLNLIEEQILENLAWKNDSPLWEKIKESEVPPCEEVLLPNQMENVQPVHLLSSPIPHPTVRRLANAERSKAQTKIVYLIKLGETKSVIDNIVPDQSPLAPPATECFNSPAATAKRRLFVPNASNGVAISVDNKNNTETDQSTIATSKQCASKIQKPKKTGSLGLFFRKFYYLASVRLRDLCERLKITDEELQRKMWTCFEYSIIYNTNLMMDRHLDQMIMCAVYVMAKISDKDQPFQEIMRCYRMQPQAASHVNILFTLVLTADLSFQVYRSVLLCTRKRRHSGSSDGSKTGASGSNSPVSLDREDDRGINKNIRKLEDCNKNIFPILDEKRKERLTIRSSSTLPLPHPSSQPPTPTRLAGTGSSFESEDRGDLVKFYNTIYVQKLQSFVLKFSAANINKKIESPPLSPLPMLKAYPTSPRRRVTTSHSVYISPLKASHVSSPPNRPLSYSFSRSPADDLRAINIMLRRGERKIGKKILQDDSDCESPSKRPCPDLALRKIQNVITERQVAVYFIISIVGFDLKFFAFLSVVLTLKWFPYK